MEYLPVLFMMTVGLVVGLAGLAISHFIGPKVRNRMKDSAFECGVPPVSSTRQRISVRFYLVAILFLLFDVEAVFFYPFGIVFRDYLSMNMFIVWEMAVFVAVLLLGYFYILKKGALEWD